MVWNRTAKVVAILIIVLMATSCSDSGDKDRRILFCYDSILQDPITTAQCKNKAVEICTEKHTPMPLSARIRESIDHITLIACELSELFGIACFFERTYKDCVVSGVQICKDFNIFPCYYRDCIDRTLSECKQEYK